MIFRELGLIIMVGIVAVAALVGWVSSRYMGDDNPIEEEMEKVIDDETGLNVDLTPETPEKKK